MNYQHESQFDGVDPRALFSIFSRDGQICLIFTQAKFNIRYYQYIRQLGCTHLKEKIKTFTSTNQA